MNILPLGIATACTRPPRACWGVIAASQALPRRARIGRQIERHELRLDARDQRGVEVIAVVGLEEEDAVAGIEERHEGGGERARSRPP